MFRKFLLIFLCFLSLAIIAKAQPSPLLVRKQPTLATKAEKAKRSFSYSQNEIVVKLKPTVTKASLTALRSKAIFQFKVGSVQVEHASYRPLYSEKQAQLKKNKALSVKALASGLDRIFVIRIDSTQTVSKVDSLIAQLSGQIDVEYVQQNNYYQLDDISSSWQVPNDSAYSSQWNLKTVKADRAWQTTKGDTAIKVGILDTGIDYTHPDLIPNLFINSAEDINHNGQFEPWSVSEKRNKKTFELDPNGVTGDFDGIDQDGNGYADDVIGWDFTDQPLNVDALNGSSDYRDPDPDPFDDNSHGTACSGIVAAATNNTIGVAGIAPNCKIVTLRAFTGSGYADDKDIASALIYAADNGIRVVNMSFGDVAISPLMRDAVQYAYSQGVVMCASSGNSGGDYQHYPSGYDEVISTGATTQDDEVAMFTTYGITLDLCAPGVGIGTTVPFYKNYYTGSFAGTSAAAPHVSAAAALILSLRPQYLPDQVRGVLVSTADDIDQKGWDHYSGAGRLNIERAALSVGSPVAKIESPVYDSGISETTPVTILGTAVSPEFESFALFYQTGTEEGQDWKEITPKTAYQKIVDTLGVWKVEALPDTEYTVRLVIYERTGRTIENRVRYVLDRTPPAVSGVSVRDAFINDRHGVLIEFKADDRVTAKVLYRPAGSNQAYKEIVLQQIKRTHYQLLQHTELISETGYEFYIEAKNISGLITRTSLGTFKLNGEVVQTPAFGQNQLKYRADLELPKGYFYNEPQDFNLNGKREVLMTESLPLEGKKYGPLKRFEYNATLPGFVLLDSVSQAYIPRSVGDVNSDGKLELVGQSAGKTIVYSQTSMNASPFSSIAFADTLSGDFWGSRIADTKGDGKKQLIARNDTAYVILDQNFNRIAFLPNTVKLAKDGSRPAFEEPKCVVQDFDADGKPEILFGDYDASFFIYEYSGSGNAYTNTWLQRTDYIGGSNSIVKGKFLNNGKHQFVIGFHSNTNQNKQDEYDAPVWVYQCWQASGDNQYQKIWEQVFYNYKSAFYFESATTAGDIDNDGIDELLILSYPNLYIFKWNQVQGKFAPIWNYPAATAAELVISDVDGNGLKEVYFCDDLKSYAFEHQNYTGPLAPVGVDAEPLGSSSINLSWLPVSGATQYKIYREKYTSGRPRATTLLTTTTSTQFTDNTVTETDVSGHQNIYVYAVTAYNGSAESDTSAYVFAWPHKLPRLVSASYDAKDNLRVSFDQPLQDTPLNSGSFILKKNGDANRLPSSVVLAKAGNDVVMSFRRAPLSVGEYALDVGSVRDIYNARIDALYNTKTFEVRRTAISRFYITSSKSLNDRQIEILFNKQIDTLSSLTLSNYTAVPDSKVSSVSIDNKRNVLVLTLSGRPIGSLGFTTSVELKNVKSIDGIVIDTEYGANVVSFSSVRENLENAFTYPNPYRASSGDGYVMFANLTRQATIDIYTMNGKRVRQIKHEGDTGGAKWQIDSDSGEKLSSGIYLYRITSNGVKEKIGKLAIVR